MPQDSFEYWMTADMSTACDTAGSSPYFYPCLLFALLIPIGLPLGVCLGRVPLTALA